MTRSAVWKQDSGEGFERSVVADNVFASEIWKRLHSAESEIAKTEWKFVRPMIRVLLGPKLG